MFAFLLDRGKHGVRKDEFLEVIWPDADVTQGDLNFHRTLNGLRSTLEPGKPPGSGSAVSFGNGRYRLSRSAVGWFDAAEFEQRLLHAALATDDLAAIRGLESARALYRGDYLDDCPLYGDSGFVEERRGFLRARLVDALVGLGQRYEVRGDNLLAAARLREALAVSGGDCQSAVAGLQRLGCRGRLEGHIVARSCRHVGGLEARAELTTGSAQARPRRGSRLSMISAISAGWYPRAARTTIWRSSLASVARSSLTRTSARDRRARSRATARPRDRRAVSKARVATSFSFVSCPSPRDLATDRASGPVEGAAPGAEFDCRA